MKRMNVLLMVFATTHLLAQETWNVYQCMEYAVSHNHQVRSKELSLDNYEASHLHAIGSFLPSIGANVGAQYNFGRAIDPETNTYTDVSTFYNGYSLYANIPIFDGLERIHTLKAAKADILMGKNDLRQQQDQTALATFQAFINVLYCQGMVEMGKEKLHECKALVRQTEVLKEVGRKSHADLAQMEAQEAEATYLLTTYQNQLSSAVLALKQEMNYPLEEELVVDNEECRMKNEESDGANGSLSDNSSSFIHSALTETPELQKRYYAQRSAYHQWQQARAAFYPSLSLGTGLSTTYYKTLNTTQAIPFHQQFRNNMGEYVSATLSIPIFNRLNTITKARKAKNNYLIAKEEYEQKRMELEKLSIEACQDLNAYIQQTKQAAKKVEADSIAYQLTRKQYEEGLNTAIDLHNTASTLLASQATLLQCQLMAWLKECLVKYYRGERIWK